MSAIELKMLPLLRDGKHVTLYGRPIYVSLQVPEGQIWKLMHPKTALNEIKGQLEAGRPASAPARCECGLMAHHVGTCNPRHYWPSP